MESFIINIVQCVSTIIALVLSTVAFFMALRARRLQQYEDIVNAFERMNALALADPSNLHVLYRLHSRDATADINSIACCREETERKKDLKQR